jgi:hypothetical protein
VNVFAFAVQHHFPDHASVGVVGDYIYNHAVTIVGKDAFTLIEEVLNEFLFMKIPVNTVVLDDVTAPAFLSSEKFMIQIFVPFEAFFNKSLANGDLFA